MNKTQKELLENITNELLFKITEKYAVKDKNRNPIIIKDNYNPFDPNCCYDPELPNFLREYQAFKKRSRKSKLMVKNYFTQEQYAA